MDLLRRDCLEKRDQRYGRPREFYFEDLTIQPRKILNYHNRDLVDSRLIRRSQMSSEPIGDEDLRFRSRSAGRRFGGVSFASALKQLHKELKEAEEIYTTFRDGFETDISNIKSYASSEILADLWDLKVNGGKMGGRRTRRSESGGAELESKIDEFDAAGTKLLNALDAVITARHSNLPGPARKNDDPSDAARHLQRKIYVAGEQIDELLGKAFRSRDCWKNLINELVFLKELIDPENEKNKEMFQAVDGREREPERNSEKASW